MGEGETDNPSVPERGDSEQRDSILHANINHCRLRKRRALRPEALRIFPRLLVLSTTVVLCNVGVPSRRPSVDGREGRRTSSTAKTQYSKKLRVQVLPEGLRDGKGVGPRPESLTGRNVHLDPQEKRDIEYLSVLEIPIKGTEPCPFSLSSFSLNQERDPFKYQTVHSVRTWESGWWGVQVRRVITLSPFGPLASLGLLPH